MEKMVIFLEKNGDFVEKNVMFMETNAIFMGKKYDFSGKKHVMFMGKKYVDCSGNKHIYENGILNRQRKRRAKPGKLKQKKKRLQKNEHFVCGRLQI